ncbi:hypothetical protein [Kitasatospora purpeofusca]|uniref:hypothetical protein n=1 Tax=Kitasatospora purpeofusca TaxID=67352 RepID=UPI0039B94E97
MAAQTESAIGGAVLADAMFGDALGEQARQGSRVTGVVRAGRGRGSSTPAGPVGAAQAMSYSGDHVEH